MCLKLSAPELHVAKEDIVCYKLLIKSSPHTGDRIPKLDVYYTPFQLTQIKVGKTYKSYLYEDELQVTLGLHSFAELHSNKAFWPLDFDFIAKCIIPKGSSYYVGIFMSKKSYASDTITYVEVKDKKENFGPVKEYVSKIINK